MFSCYRIFTFNCGVANNRKSKLIIGKKNYDESTIGKAVWPGIVSFAEVYKYGVDQDRLGP